MCAFISYPAQNWLFYKCDLSLLPFFLKDFLDFTSIVVVLFFLFLHPVIFRQDCYYLEVTMEAHQ